VKILLNRSLRQSTNKKFKRGYASRVRYKPGQYVRISRTKNTFEPGYEKNFSEEVFRVQRVSRRQGLYTYILSDLNGEEIDGFFIPKN